jgi:hypothetical protein
VLLAPTVTKYHLTGRNQILDSSIQTQLNESRFSLSVPIWSRLLALRLAKDEALSGNAHTLLDLNGHLNQSLAPIAFRPALALIIPLVDALRSQSRAAPRFLEELILAVRTPHAMGTF